MAPAALTGFGVVVQPLSDSVGRRIARIAINAHGVVTRAELLAAGITVGQIKHRLACGALIRVYSGVYLVGHATQTTEARYMAAVKACGKGAVLCGNAGGYLLSVQQGAAPPPEVMTVTPRRIAGIKTRWCRHIDPRDITSVKGIPVTNAPRTLVDLARCLAEDDLARACHEAGVRYGVTPRKVESVLSRRPNSPGAAKLRRIMRGEVKVTLSRLESTFLQLLRGNDLPLPETNRRAGSRRVDCRWPEHRLTVELDSYTYHSSRHAWEQDRRREREAHARGDDFRRYTYGDVFEHRGQMLRELKDLLRRRQVRVT